jgi:hypothetical protein
MSANQPEAPSIQELIANASIFRRDMLAGLIDANKCRDIDKECGYPARITAEDCKALYDREGIASRIVAVEPAESWKKDPEVIEGEQAKDTQFEKDWKALQSRMNLYAQLQKVDRISGIGTFGILLMGVNDGKTLDQPIEGLDIDPETSRLKRLGKPLKLLYTRAFDETAVSVHSYETNDSSPRFGRPILYSINFARVDSSSSQATTAVETYTKQVHWTRVLHVADNCESSEVFGVERMRNVWNRLFDLRKLLAASGEMFWKGGFPGVSFEVDPNIQTDGAEFDREGMRKEMERYSNGLQRYLALVGVSAKSLAVQVADPTAHFEVALKAIAVSKGIPWRILLGSEEAKLASEQDGETWNERVQGRQSKYVTPCLLRPFVDWCIAVGAVSEPKNNEYVVVWPSLSDPTPAARADVASKTAEALSKFTGGGVDTIVPPREFMTHVLGWTEEVVDAIMKASDKYALEVDPEQEFDAEGNPIPPPTPASAPKGKAATTEPNAGKAPPPKGKAGQA